MSHLIKLLVKSYNRALWRLWRTPVITFWNTEKTTAPTDTTSSNLDTFQGIGPLKRRLGFQQPFISQSFCPLQILRPTFKGLLLGWPALWALRPTSPQIACQPLVLAEEEKGCKRKRLEIWFRIPLGVWSRFLVPPSFLKKEKNKQTFLKKTSLGKMSTPARRRLMRDFKRYLDVYFGSHILCLCL